MAKTSRSSAGGLGLIPGQGTRSQSLQLNDPTCCNEDLAQPKKYIHKKKHTHTHKQTTNEGGFILMISVFFLKLAVGVEFSQVQMPFS